MLRPTERSTVEDRILNIQPSTALHQQTHYIFVPGECRLMQRRRMRVAPWRVETIRIFPGIEEHPYNPHMSKLRGNRQRSVPGLRCGRPQ